MTRSSVASALASTAAGRSASHSTSVPSRARGHGAGERGERRDRLERAVAGRPGRRTCARSRKRWSDSHSESKPERLGLPRVVARSSRTAAATRPRPSSRTAAAPSPKRTRASLRARRARDVGSLCVLECVPNVSEGRDAGCSRRSRAACGPSLLDVHADADHHRSVFTLAGPGPRDAVDRGAGAGRGPWPSTSTCATTPASTRGSARSTSCRSWRSTRPRDGGRGRRRGRVRRLGRRPSSDVPVFLYDDADPAGRTLPDVRRDAFARSRARPRARAPAPAARRGRRRRPAAARRGELLARRPTTSPWRARDRRGGPRARRRAPGRAGPRASRSPSVGRDAGVDEPGRPRALPGSRPRAPRCARRAEAAGGTGHAGRARRARARGRARPVLRPTFLAWAGLGPDVTIEARLAR